MLRVTKLILLSSAVAVQLSPLVLATSVPVIGATMALAGQVTPPATTAASQPTEPATLASGTSGLPDAESPPSSSTPTVVGAQKTPCPLPMPGKKSKKKATTPGLGSFLVGVGAPVGIADGVASSGADAEGADAEALPTKTPCPLPMPKKNKNKKKKSEKSPSSEQVDKDSFMSGLAAGMSMGFGNTMAALAGQMNPMALFSPGIVAAPNLQNAFMPGLRGALSDGESESEGDAEDGTGLDDLDTGMGMGMGMDSGMMGLGLGLDMLVPGDAPILDEEAAELASPSLMLPIQDMTGEGGGATESDELGSAAGEGPQPVESVLEASGGESMNSLVDALSGAVDTTAPTSETTENTVALPVSPIVADPKDLLDADGIAAALMDEPSRVRRQ